jgi:hypothetical protein
MCSSLFTCTGIVALLATRCRGRTEVDGDRQQSVERSARASRHLGERTTRVVRLLIE